MWASLDNISWNKYVNEGTVRNILISKGTKNEENAQQNMFVHCTYTVYTHPKLAKIAPHQEKGQ